MNTQIGEKMIEAALVGDLRLVRQYLDEGIDPDSQDPEGHTALHQAAFSGHSEIVSKLIRVGANVDARTRGITETSGQTPLMSAAMTARTESPSIISILLQAGSDPNVQDERGRTALIWCALRSGDVAAARALINGGADPTLTDENGRTALDHARKENNTELAEYLQDITRNRGSL